MRGPSAKVFIFISFTDCVPILRQTQIRWHGTTRLKNSKHGRCHTLSSPKHQRLGKDAPYTKIIMHAYVTLQYITLHYII